MPYLTSSPRRPSRATAIILSGLIGSLAACSSSDDDDETPTTPDTTAPGTSSLVQNRTLDATGQTLTVTFDEVVTAATAEVIASYTVSGGVNVTAADLRVNGTTVDLTLDAPAIPGDNTLAIAAGIEDAAGNAADAVAATAITSTDTTAPAAASIAGTTVSGLENDMITVVFNDNMIEAEVEALANWTIESPLGSAFDATGATIEYVDSTRTATITLGAGATDQNLQTFDDIHANFITMRDIGGNVVSTTAIGTTAIAGDVEGDDEAPVLLATAPGSGSTMVMTFSEAVSSLETADLVATAGAAGTDIVITDVSDPGDAAAGTIELTGTVQDGDSITISDGATAVEFEFDYGGQGSVAFSTTPADTDTIAITDVGGTTDTYEFDDGLGGGVSGGNIAVTIGADADLTAANFLAAVNGGTVATTASAGASNNIVALRQDLMGAAGNTTIVVMDSVGGVITETNFTGGGIAGDVEVPVDTMSIPTTVTSLRGAIDGDAFNVTTSNGSAAEDFIVENDAVGAAGNVSITETDAGGAITIAGMTGGVDAGVATYVPTVSAASGMQATVTFATAPEASDTIRVYGVTDLAGNQMLPETAATLVAASATEPALGIGTQVISTVSGEGNDQIVVDFAAPIHPDGAADAANYVLDDGAAVDISAAEFSFDGTDQVTIDLAAVNIETAGTYSLSVDNIMSLQGVAQTSASTEAAISPTGDSTAPTIGASDARIDPLTANSILITFDEAISETGGVDTANYAVAGNTTTAAAFVTPRVVRVTFQNAVAVAETVDVSVAAVTDLAGNAAVGVATVAIAAADGTAPTIASIAGDTATSSGLHQIVVTFDESVPFAGAETPGNYSITSGGTPVDFTGATFSASSAGDTVIIELPASTRLTTADALSVVPANITDAAGNAISTAAVAGTVAGDAAGPATAVAFVNRREMATGEIVDVFFNEMMDQTTTETLGNWSGSGGQAATSVTRINGRLYRVTFDAPIGPAETVSAATPTDVAGNAGATITVNPVE